MSQTTNPVLKRCGPWVVTTYGLECLTHFYPIERHRLWALDSERHVSLKPWVHAESFRQALQAARERHSSFRPQPRQEASHQGGSAS